MKLVNFIKKFIKKKKKKSKPEIHEFDLKIFVEELYKVFMLKGIWQKKAWVDAALKTIDVFEIKNVCYFFAQVAHESGGFKYTRENLKYRAESLLRIFKKYFTKKEAYLLEKNEKAIAQKIYINRMGNKTEDDAWNYIGRGFIQLTGKNNYKAISEDMRINFLKNPDILEALPCCFYSAGWFWLVNKLDKQKDFKKLTRKINGGYNGLSHRYEMLQVVEKAKQRIEKKIRVIKK